MSVVDYDYEGRGRMLSGELLLNGVEVDVAIGDGLVSFDEELTVDGSPIIRIGVLDVDRVMIESGLFDLTEDDDDRLDREVELLVDGEAVYWLREVNKVGDVFELTFEDREVCRLRDRRGAIKVAAATIGDRGFIRSLCRRAGVPEPITPEPGPKERAARRKLRLDTKLKIKDDRRARDDRLEPGIADDARLTVKGAPASADQLKIGSLVLSACRADGAGPKATLAAMEAAIIENELSNSGVINDPGSTSVGVFQAQYGLSEGIDDKVVTREEALDVAYMTRCFLEDRAGGGFASKGGARYLERTRPSITAHEIAILVEAPAAQYEYRYQTVEREARRWIELFDGGTLPISSGTGSVSRTIESPLTVERGESYWDAARRIAESYGARFFVVTNQPYYVRDEALMRSRPRMTLSEDSPGVHQLDWEWAPHKRLRRTDLECNVAAWQAPPGSVVVLDDDCGPAAGRWLVHDYERSRYDDTARVMLVKGRKPEVPIETETIETGSAGGSASLPLSFSADGVPEPVMRALAEAHRIDQQNLPYVWGGGHAFAGRPDGGTGRDPGIGFDCSGYTGAQLAAADLAYTGTSVPGSGSMTSLGQAGEGKWMTIWANAAHVFVVYRLPSGIVRADTAGGPPSGPHLRKGETSTAGFTPRHFAGT